MNKKTISRTIILMTILLVCTAIGAFYYVNIESQERKGKLNLFSLIPQDCEAVMEISNIRDLFHDLHYSAFIDKYNELQISDIINLLNERIINLSEQKAHSIGGQMNHLLVSFHSPDTPENQVVYGHLSSESKKFIESMLKTENHKKAKYKGETIVIYPLNNEKFISCYFGKSFYALSFQKKLIEQVIDTYQKRTTSICNDSTFNTLSSQKKPINSVYLYVRCQPLSNWIEFNLRIHNDAIYLAGNCRDNSDESLVQAITQGKKMNLITERLLPENTVMFYQFTLSDKDSLALASQQDSLPPTPSASPDFIKEYAQGEINSIEFGNDTVDSHHILLLSLSQPITIYDPGWRSLCKAFPQYKWINGKVYTIYPLQEKTIANLDITPSFSHEKKPMFATLYNNEHVLLSDEANDLVTYLQDQTSQVEKPAPFQKEMANLSQETNFTFFTDMKSLLQNQQYAHFIPEFFLKHKEFFKHFTFSLQLVKAPENINANVILTYKDV